MHLYLPIIGVIFTSLPPIPPDISKADDFLNEMDILSGIKANTHSKELIITLHMLQPGP
jgi:hypothetical protein